MLPLVVLLFFGIIDGGRYLWEVNRASKATQAGARAAAVTHMVPQGLANYSFAISAGIPQGQPVSEAYFTGVQCEQAGGSVDCDWLGSPSDDFDLDPLDCAFDTVVNRMRVFMPRLETENVVVAYYNSGLGFSGDPSGPDVAPLISVRLKDIDFQPILTGLFGLSWPLPSSDYTITQEDGMGWKYEEVPNDNECDASA